jgi:ribosomal protein S8
MKILSINYSIIINGFIKKFSSVSIYHSNLSLLFLDVLVREGVIRGYRPLRLNKIQVFLKYYKGRSVITDIKSISSSSCSIYFDTYLRDTKNYQNT